MLPDQISGLRRGVGEIARDIRVSRLPQSSPDEPIFVQNYDILLEGQKYKRKKIILAAPGCSSATCTMCPIPNESFWGNTTQVGPDNYINQFRAAFKDEDPNDFEMIALYNSGNWFADREVPQESRIWFYDYIAKSKCASIAVESLPQFINEKTLAEARVHLDGKKLIVGIGLQSADDFIRTVCINTTCTKPQFEHATKLLKEYGYTPRVYLMIKPPFLTEKEAIDEAANSIQYTSSLGYADASICPTRIAPHTVVDELAKRDLFTPPSLWSVIEILKRVDKLGIQTRVSCLDVDGKDGDTVYPRNCEKCTPKILKSLVAYNLGEANINDLELLDCDCKQHYEELAQEEQETIGSLPLPQRVRHFLELYNQTRLSVIS